MKKNIALSFLLAGMMLLPWNLSAQNEKKHKGQVKNIIEVDDNVDKTSVKFPGGNIEVNNFSDPKQRSRSGINGLK